MSKVLIIGGGAAGMFAAITAAGRGHEVHLYEKNEKLGKKLYITGKGRCNLTNACDLEDLFNNVCTNSKFLYSAFYGCSNQDVIHFFEENGMRTKIERGNRVFPASDHSADVIDTLRSKMRKSGVRVHLNQAVAAVTAEDQKFSAIRLEDGQIISADAVIIATGGLSYQSTGSTGDGYRFGEMLGHKITALSPSLVPLKVREEIAGKLQGLSLRNVGVRILDGKKCLYEDFGEMLFTHYGVSGPLILTGSCFVQKKLAKKELTLRIDLKPALSFEQLDKRVLRDFSNNQNKQFKNVMGDLFPAKLVPVMLERSGIAPDQVINEISKEQRHHFIHTIKNFELTITGLRDYNEAVITKGGIHVKEINPATMESKLVSGIFFAGEVIDLDALTGGFNLQIAWSTAYAAGNGVR